MRPINKILLMLAMLACASIASATILTVNCSTISGLTELNGSLACPQFGGVGLQSVMITVNGSISGSITLTNNSATNTETGTGTTTSGFTVGPLAGFTISTPLFTAMFNTGMQTLTPGQSKTSSGLAGSGTASINDTTVFAPYTGAGNFSIPVATATMLNISGGGGNFAGSQTTNGQATASVTYTFAGATVPEVSTPIYLITGLGALVIGLWRRRSR